MFLVTFYNNCMCKIQLKLIWGVKKSNLTSIVTNY